MTHVLDGHTGLEHNIPVAPLYDDALSLMAASKSGYTPTLIVNYGGLSGEYYWYQHDDVWKNPRLRHFTPDGVLDARARRRASPPRTTTSSWNHRARPRRSAIAAAASRPGPTDRSTASGCTGRSGCWSRAG